jgi:hypothetical protein
MAAQVPIPVRFDAGAGRGATEGPIVRGVRRGPPAVALTYVMGARPTLA